MTWLISITDSPRKNDWARYVGLTPSRRGTPISCDACGQTEGYISGHSEDYSFPYGDHIGRFGVCYRCHMMIHCRFKNPEAWETYKAHLREGRVFAPIGRNFWLFRKQTLDAKGIGVLFKQGPAKASTFLDAMTSPTAAAGQGPSARRQAML